MKDRFGKLMILFVFVVILFCQQAIGQTIVYPSGGSDMELLAAKEVRRYIYLRTDQKLDLQGVTSLPGSEDLILVANDDDPMVESLRSLINHTTNPGGFIIKTVNSGGWDILVITGNDSATTLQAAYRYAEHLGVGFGLAGDAIPDAQITLDITGFDEVGEPLFPTRGIMPHHDFPPGPDVWNTDDYMAVISQLPKLGMNFIGLRTYTKYNTIWERDNDHRRGPEPTVWIGLPEDVNSDGTVSWSYPAYYAHTHRPTYIWGFDTWDTDQFHAGSSQLFDRNAWGSDVFGTTMPSPGNMSAWNQVHNNVGQMFNEAFTHAQNLGVKTCTGTELPLGEEYDHGDTWVRGMPTELQTRLIGMSKDPADPAVVKDVYKAIFDRIAKTHPLDYYWLWSWEIWSDWDPVTSAEIQSFENDMNIAQQALSELGNPFQIGHGGWRLGTVNPLNPAEFEDVFPSQAPFFSLWGSATGYESLSAQRVKWPSTYLEYDFGLGQPQLAVYRVHEDALASWQKNCDGLISCHWRTRIMSPAIGSMKDLLWCYGPTGTPVTKTVPSDGGAFVDAYYVDWATRQFGPEVASSIAAIFAGQDWEVLPHVMDFVEEMAGSFYMVPGGILPNSTSWSSEQSNYDFVGDLEALRPQIVGAGNLERFDYWLKAMQALRIMGEYGCIRDDFENACGAGNWSTALNHRISMANLWEQLMTLVVEKATNASDLGEILNLEIVNWKQLMMNKWDAAMEAGLGGSLPPEANPDMNYTGSACVKVTPARTQVYDGQSLDLTVLIMENPTSATLYYRPLGGGSYTNLSLTNVARGVYEVTIPAQSDDFEYYIDAQTPIGNAVYPASAPAINQTVVVLTAGGPPDTDPPTPDPMTWQTFPYATSSSSIAMEASTATDPSGVEYYFTCTGGGGSDSGWQDSASYTDTGLSAETQYCYEVAARDKSSNQNETAVSSEQCATTEAAPTEVTIIGSWTTGLSHTAASGSNRVLIFTAHAQDNQSAGSYLNSVTYGGQSMTKIDESEYYTDPYHYYVAAWILDEAGITAASGSNFAVTWSDGGPSNTPGYSSVFLENVDQATPIGANATNNCDCEILSTTALATNDGDMVMLTALHGGNSASSTNYECLNGFTEALEFYDPPNSGEGLCGYKAATGANETPSVDSQNNNYSGRQALIGFVVQAGAAAPPDTDPPTPDPMTWATVPYATGSSSIAMVATTASDASSVEYNFDETSGNPGGSDSGWQDSTSYTDTGLSAETQYCYRVQARDKSVNQNATAWSSPDACATTQAAPTEVTILGSWVEGTSHTAESGSDRALIFTAHAEDNDTAMNASVTYGGQSMTKIIEQNEGTGYRAYVAAFVLDEAGIAAASDSTFNVSWAQSPSRTPGFSSVFLSGVDQTNPIGASAGNGNTSSPIATSALATDDGDMVVVGGAVGATGSYTCDNGFTEALEVTVESGDGVAGYKTATGANETPQLTHSAVNRQVIIGFVVQAGAAAPPDTTPPTPDPMTWATAPYSTGETSIAMVATTATDASGVEYNFDETSGNPGGSDSGWQDSTSYTDTGLTSSTQYCYQVQARDKSVNQNATAVSTNQCATTDTPDTTPPTPDPATFASAPAAISDTAISMTATTGSDASPPVEYYFDETSLNPGGSDSGWQTSASYTDTGLSASTQYTYTVQMRDSLLNTGTASSPASATTQAPPPDTDPPTPNPATFASPPAAISDTAISMTATTGSDASPPVEYYFDETSLNPGGSDSGWQTSASYTDTGLSASTQYTYTVQMRDSVPNTGTASSPANATTQAPPDTDPPTPNPATFASPPAADSSSAISMTATTGSDASPPVEYYFDETSGNPGATDSGWQTSASYTDTGLDADTQYTYTVQMRDSVPNTGTASSPANATTDPVSGWTQIISDDFEGGFGNWNDGGADCKLYTGGTYAHQGSNALDLEDNTSTSVATTDNLALAGYAEVKVDFWYICVSMDNSNEDFWLQISTNGGSSFDTVEEWNLGDEFQNDNFYPDSVIISGYTLNNTTQLRFRCDASGGADDVYIDEVVVSASGEPVPDTDPPTPNPATWASVPSADSSSAISMTATTGSDPSGVQYSFDETSGNPGGSDSGWQSSASYTDTGLNASTQYTYRVRMRDQSPNQNTGSWSTSESATTTGGGTWQKVDDRNASVTRYGSDWTLGDGWIPGAYMDTLSITSSSGNYAIYSFTGTKVRLYAGKADDGGTANIYIDDAPDGTVNFFDSSDLGDVLVYESGTLSSGSHELKVEWASGTRIYLDAFESYGP